MYVDAPNLVALPVWWGSGTPESAIAIRTPPVVAALDLLFSLLWATSNAWTDDDEPWVDVLRLLSGGLTDDSVARTLGTTSRTVRRRIAEATIALTAEATAHVDAHLAPYAHKIGLAQLDRLVAEAIARFMPDQARANASCTQS